MKKDPKTIHSGLIAWREYGRSLSQAEVFAQVRKYENEGFIFAAERNSETVLMFYSNEGLSFPEWRLRALRLHWQRSPLRFAQLDAAAKQMIDEVGRNRGYRSFSDRMTKMVQDSQSK